MYLLFIISRVVSKLLISLAQTNNATWQDGNTTFQYETRILPGYDHSGEHGKYDSHLHIRVQVSSTMCVYIAIVRYLVSVLL